MRVRSESDRARSRRRPGIDQKGARRRLKGAGIAQGAHRGTRRARRRPKARAARGVPLAHVPLPATRSSHFPRGSPQSTGFASFYGPSHTAVKRGLDVRHRPWRRRRAASHSILAAARCRARTERRLRAGEFCGHHDATIGAARSGGRAARGRPGVQSAVWHSQGCDHQEERYHDDLVRTQARDLRRHQRDDDGGRGSALRGGPRPLRDLRPHLPRALRAPLQLRADVGPPRRVDLVGAFHDRDPLRVRRLRRRRPRPRGRRHRLVRGRPQGDGPLRPVGPARRGDPRRASRAPAGRREAAPAPRGPARLPPQPDHLDAALHRAARQGARRAPDAGDAVREALDRRLRRRRGQLDRPGLRGGRLLRRGRPPRAHLRGRGRPHARPRGRGARRGRHGLAGQRDPAPRLEPGLDRLRPRLPRRRHTRRLRAVGSHGALLPARLERRLRARGPRLPADRRRAAPRPGDRQRTADGRDLPHAQGLEVRHRGQGVARRRPQAVFGRVLRGARRADRRPQGVAAGLRGRGSALPGGRRRHDHGGLLLGVPAGDPRPGRGERGHGPRAGRPAGGGPRPARPARARAARRARRASRRSTRSRAARRRRSPRSCASSPAPRRRCATSSDAACTTSTRRRAARS